LLASYAFYCTWDVRMAAILLVATVFCFAAAIRIQELRGRKAASILTFSTVSAFLLYLMFFKVRPLLGTNASIAIPLGISYYTFRFISYLLDVYWGKYDAERQFVPFAAYVAFFPHMVAGPIQRASSFLPQLSTPDNSRHNTVFAAILRILIGFFKKTVVADNIGLFVNYGYQHLHSGFAIPNLAAFYLYPLQLYADFGGLTDIAIGTGMLLGIESPENFELPFWAQSITEFWRRWHMSLTSWLRDYVFVPLRMATRNWGEFGLMLSLTLNMILIGLWHGFSLAFLAFGLFHASILLIDVLSSSQRKKVYKRNPRVAVFSAILGPVLTYTLVSVGNTFFRAPSFEVAAQLLKGLTSSLAHPLTTLTELMAPPNHYAWVAFPAFAMVEFADWIRVRKKLELPALVPRWVRWSAYACVTVTCILVALLFLARQPGADPFVYAKF
jgi:alginate O-acetyltransferase complex protein AlgI